MRPGQHRGSTGEPPGKHRRTWEKHGENVESCGKMWKLRRNVEVSICEVLEETEFGGKYEVHSDFVYGYGVFLLDT